MTDYGYNEFLAEKLMYVPKPPQEMPPRYPGAEVPVWYHTSY
jgi:hypothetical protein